MCLKTEHLKILDIRNYLEPGFNYAQFLKVYDCPQEKGFFPYKLDETHLPPHQAFHSSLTHSNISLEEYQYCQRVWTEQGMQSFREFLVWYNNLDVQPFVISVKKMLDFWQEREIYWRFKDGVSVPGLTMNYLFNVLDEQMYFSLFNEKNKDLYDLFKDNNTGGPSIIFHRYHEAGKTKICEVEMRSKGIEHKNLPKNYRIWLQCLVLPGLVSTNALDRL